MSKEHTALFFVAGVISLSLSLAALLRARLERKWAENYRWEAENLFHMAEQLSEED